jgi:5-methylcytosine-specific restriction endonuclease McrA
MSYSGVRYWLKKYALVTQHRGPGRATQMEGDELVCIRHGRARGVRTGSGRRCAQCRAERVAARRRRIKEILVEEAGGRCARCGYDRYTGALQFHHLDPAAKSFALGLSGLCRSLSAMRAEAAKCILLCANCHAEVEWDRTIQNDADTVQPWD